MRPGGQARSAQGGDSQSTSSSRSSCNVSDVSKVPRPSTAKGDLPHNTAQSFPVKQTKKKKKLFDPGIHHPPEECRASLGPSQGPPSLGRKVQHARCARVRTRMSKGLYISRDLMLSANTVRINPIIFLSFSRNIYIYLRLVTCCRGRQRHTARRPQKKKKQTRRWSSHTATFVFPQYLLVSFHSPLPYTL